ncbi:MAG: hypothetical protein AAF494_01725 [Pseudomonadota bacterium]
MISGRLTMRAAVERNQAVGTDAWGDALPPDFQLIHTALPCFAWSRSGRELVDGSKTALIEDARIMVALGADLLEGDEITAISDRSGNILIPGRLRVEGRIQYKHSHREAALESIE